MVQLTWIDLEKKIVKKRDKILNLDIKQTTYLFGNGSEQARSIASDPLLPQAQCVQVAVHGILGYLRQIKSLCEFFLHILVHHLMLIGIQVKRHVFSV